MQSKNPQVDGVDVRGVSPIQVILIISVEPPIDHSVSIHPQDFDALQVLAYGESWPDAWFYPINSHMQGYT